MGRQALAVGTAALTYACVRAKATRTHTRWAADMAGTVHESATR